MFWQCFYVHVFVDCKLKLLLDSFTTFEKHNFSLQTIVIFTLLNVVYVLRWNSENADVSVMNIRYFGNKTLTLRPPAQPYFNNCSAVTCPATLSSLHNVWSCLIWFSAVHLERECSALLFSLVQKSSAPKEQRNVMRK